MISKLTRFALFLSVAGMFFIASCGDDDGPDETDVNELVGVWITNSITYTNCTDPTDNDTELFQCNAQDCFRIEFTTDGRYIQTELFDGDTTIDEGTYVVSGNNLTIRLDGEVNELTYTVSGNSVSLVVPADDDGCVVTLSGTKE